MSFAQEWQSQRTRSGAWGVDLAIAGQFSSVDGRLAGSGYRCQTGGPTTIGQIRSCYRAQSDAPNDECGACQG